MTETLAAFFIDLFGNKIPAELKIPHIGWNGLHFCKNHPLFKYIKEEDHVYFVHSYAAMDCDDAVIADTEYGAYLTAAVANGNNTVKVSDNVSNLRISSKFLTISEIISMQ